MLVEKAITYLTIPCEYGQHGCKMEIPYRDKEAVSPFESSPKVIKKNIAVRQKKSLS
jgi:hypothetical protein